MLYELIPQAPRPSIYPTKPPTKTLVDGVVSSIQPSLTTKPSKQPNVSTISPSNPTVSVKVNAIQSSQEPNNKK